MGYIERDFAALANIMPLCEGSEGMDRFFERMDEHKLDGIRELSRGIRTLQRCEIVMDTDSGGMALAVLGMRFLTSMGIRQIGDALRAAGVGTSGRDAVDSAEAAYESTRFVEKDREPRIRLVEWVEVCCRLRDLPEMRREARRREAGRKRAEEYRARNAKPTMPALSRAERRAKQREQARLRMQRMRGRKAA